MYTAGTAHKRLIRHSAQYGLPRPVLTSGAAATSQPLRIQCPPVRFRQRGHSPCNLPGGPTASPGPSLVCSEAGYYVRGRPFAPCV